MARHERRAAREVVSIGCVPWSEDDNRGHTVALGVDAME